MTVANTARKITKIWLTPSALTVHRGNTESRFTVLALFGDNTIGDITNWPQLEYSTSDDTVVNVCNCADICGVTARVLARMREADHELLRAQLQACVQACVLCGDECEAHAGMHAHCKVCAALCRRCEEACRQAIGKLTVRH